MSRKRKFDLMSSDDEGHMDEEWVGGEKPANQVFVHAWCWNQSDKHGTVEEFKGKFKQLEEELKPIIGKKGQYLFQLEQGEEGNWHYQGYLRLSNKRRSHTLGAELGQKFPGIWIKPAVAGQGDALRRYCIKQDATYRAGPWADKPINQSFGKSYEGKGLPEYKSLYPFQAKIVDDVKAACTDDRSINWVYDPIGGVGKSILAKYIVYHRLGYFVSVAKASDIANVVIKRGAAPAYMFDIPRTKSNQVSDDELYQILEQVKNGMVFTGKYEGGELLMDPPHIWVFSNFYPNYSKMSHGRFKVYSVTAATRELVPAKPPIKDGDDEVVDMEA